MFKLHSGCLVCGNEAKGFCDACDQQFCFNHSAGHEKFTCPKLQVSLKSAIEDKKESE